MKAKQQAVLYTVQYNSTEQYTEGQEIHLVRTCQSYEQFLMLWEKHVMPKKDLFSLNLSKHLVCWISRH